MIFAVSRGLPNYRDLSHRVRRKKEREIGAVSGGRFVVISLSLSLSLSILLLKDLSINLSLSRIEPLSRQEAAHHAFLLSFFYFAFGSPSFSYTIVMAANRRRWAGSSGSTSSEEDEVIVYDSEPERHQLERLRLRQRWELASVLNFLHV